MITKIGAYIVEEIQPGKDVAKKSHRLMRDVLNTYDALAPGSISDAIRKRTANRVAENIGSGKTYGVKDNGKIIGFGVVTPDGNKKSLDYVCR